ncbi:MAG: hypothetical protein ACT4PV_10880 [Planctomycetaceae bacterium]
MRPKPRPWATVIVPTALPWRHGGRWPAAYGDDLFSVACDEETLIRFEMSGASFTDIDSE